MTAQEIAFVYSSPKSSQSSKSLESIATLPRVIDESNGQGACAVELYFADIFGDSGRTLVGRNDW